MPQEDRNTPGTASTPFARRVVKYVVGFGVGFVVGLAPYLGAVDVPGFRALLTLFPSSIRDVMIPLSGAVMGLVIVNLQWHSQQGVPQRWLDRRFGIAWLISILLLAALVIAFLLTVVTVRLDGGKSAVSFVVGLSRTSHCACRVEMSNAECIKNISLDEAAIASCWGDPSIALSKFALVALYLAVTGSFVWLVGLVVIRMRR